ncbi:hypothetical protein DRU84_23945, partial [Salmonella enterica subsp. enterica serovar Kentucky]|nr:hypothetical protein [Salmonella enterica subsp. enterica serovar Kentucky]
SVGSFFDAASDTLAPDAVDAFFTSYPCIVFIEGHLLTFRSRCRKAQSFVKAQLRTLTLSCKKRCRGE